MQTPRTNDTKEKEQKNTGVFHTKVGGDFERHIPVYIAALLSFVSIILYFTTRDIAILFTSAIVGSATIVVWRYYFRS
jgi:hypothetical protein